MSLANREKSKSFNVGDYMIVYEEVMKNNLARECFRDYLQNVACSDESILFLDEYERYKQEYSRVFDMILNQPNLSEIDHHCGEIYDMAEGLMYKFIKPESEKELNVGKPKIDLWKRWKDEISSCSILEFESFHKVFHDLDPNLLFHDIVTSVNLDLRIDQFPRFSRSPQIYTLLEKQGETFTRAIAVDISRGYHVDFRFKPKDLVTNLIFDRDLYFAFSLMEDSPDWQTIENSKKTQAQFYYSKTPYVFEDQKHKGMHMCKVVCNFDYPLEDVWKVLRHVISLDEPGRTVSNIRQLGYIPPNSERKPQMNVDESADPSEYNTLGLTFSTCELDFKVPGMKKRDIPHTHTTIYDQALQGYVNVGHTSFFNGYETPKDCVHADLFIFYYVCKISPFRTRFTHIVYSDGHLPAAINKIVTITMWKKRALYFEKIFNKILKDFTDNGSRLIREGELTDCFGLDKSARDNLQAFPNRSWYEEYLKMLHTKNPSPRLSTTSSSKSSTK